MSGEYVVDASLAVKWILRGEPLRNKARDFLAGVGKAKGVLIAPPIFYYEIETIVQRKLVTKQINLAEAETVLKKFYAIQVVIENPAGLVFKAREIARLTRQERIYDSLYAGLAELRQCEFWTADRAFYEAAKRQLASVQFLADYN